MANRKHILFGIVLLSVMLTGLHAAKNDKNETPVPKKAEEISKEILSTNDTLNASVTDTDSDNTPSMFVSKKHLKKIKDEKLKKEKAAKAPKVKNYKVKEAIVVLKKRYNDEGFKKIKNDKSLKILKKYKFKTKSGDKVVLFIKTNNLDTEKLVKKFKDLYFVESASPNYINKVQANIPDDQYFNSLWGLRNTGQTGGTIDADINATNAWDTQTGSDNTIIAVVDSGVDYTHDDLTVNMWTNTAETLDGSDTDGNGYIDDIKGYDFYDGDNDPMDVYGHGTHVAGTIGARGNNGIGVTGVSWNTKIMALKVGADTNLLGGQAIWDAITYVIAMKQRGVNIVAVNASYGHIGGDQSDPMNGLIKDLEAEGVLFCAAAGNGGDDGVGDDNDDPLFEHYPSSYNADNIIAVAATDHYDDQSSFSNYGITSVDLSAPGSSILSTIIGARSYAPHSRDVFFDDLESDMGNWETGGDHDWIISETQDDFIGSPASPTHFLSDKLGNRMHDWSEYWVRTQNNIDISAYTGETLYLGFGAAVAIYDDGNNHAYVEVSGDGGTSWTILHDFKGSDSLSWNNPYRYEIPGPLKTNQFKIRFRIITNGLNYLQSGWLIDNVGIGNFLSSQYGYKQGTSMATPHVAGAVAMISSEFPDENITVKKDRILVSTDALVATGKTVTDGRLNLYNALQNPALVSITPQYGMTVDQVIRLDGHSFGDVTGKVAFDDEDNNTLEATVLEWHDTWIDAQIPSGYPGKKIRVERSVDSKSRYINGSRWSEDIAIPANIDSASAVAYNGKIYLFGGQTDFTVSSTVHIYDTSTLTWSTGTSMLTSRAYSTASLIGDKVYVIGGYSPSAGGVQDVVEVYDISDNAWTTVAPFPTAIAFSAAATIGDKLYVSGGTTDGKSAENTLFEYNSISDTWTSKASLSTNKSAHGMIAQNNKLYLFGGSDWDYTVGADYSQSHEMWVYDPTLDTWSAGTNMSSGLGTVRFGYALGTEKGETVIKLTGGNRGQWWWSDKEQTVMTYNFTTDQWYHTNEGLDELIYGKFGTSTVFIDSVGFYSIGGFDDRTSQSMNDVEQLGYVVP